MSKKVEPRVVPSWEDYFMGLCLIVASRSKDPNTQIGSLIVDENNRIQGTGYNGPPKCIYDTDIEWDRKSKYKYIIHAEANAIDYAIGNLKNSTLYVTGRPCLECMKRILSKGIKKVLYGSQKISMISEENWEETKEVFKKSRLIVEEYKGNLNWVRDRINSIFNHT